MSSLLRHLDLSTEDLSISGSCAVRRGAIRPEWPRLQRFV